MRKKINANIAIGIIAAASAALIFGFAKERKSPFVVTETTPPEVQRVVVLPPPGFDVMPAPAEPEPPKTDVQEKMTTVPLAYFPPPSVNLSGAKLGNQRVPGTDSIGDVYQIVFHDPTQALFMAVIEHDGTRSVWRLDQHGQVDRVFYADAHPGEITIFVDSRGTIYVMHDNPVRLYRTGDAFKSWQLVLKDAPGMFWQIADDAKGTVWGSLHAYNDAVLYHSPDNGFSWEPWKDFQKIFPEYAVQYDPGDKRLKMRHLHGVVYNHLSDSLLVGTGDVARFTLESTDNGDTWHKVWDEGFTGSVVMSRGNRILLCPDSLHKHGIALYDIWGKTIQEVWTPARHNFAGYCYSMANVDGMYYAAFHTEANEVESIVPKFGIIASPDGITWYSFLEWGPLTHHARSNIWLASAPARVYASVNGALYAFKPLDRDWFKDQTPFGK